MIRVFIGYDEGEKVAYHVLCESIRKLSTKPVSFTPLSLNTIKDSFTREKVSNQTTDFAFSRYIIPYLCDYKGWSLFMDCDMLFLEDIAKLWNLRDDQYAIMCCKHDYNPNQNLKFRGAKNEPFEKKNWSSFMLMNNEKCTALTPEFVNTASGLTLHQFKWLEDDKLIGDLPLEWNWLVSEYPKIQKPYNLHYTLGGPYFKDYENCDYNEEWYEVWNEMAEINL